MKEYKLDAFELAELMTEYEEWRDSLHLNNTFGDFLHQRELIEIATRCTCN